MKIQKFYYENNDIVQIYINKIEQGDSKIIEEINKLKKKCSDISIFVSGEDDTVKTIKEMLNYEKSRKDI
jgi:tRNA-dihydrouridine synthase